MIKKFFGNFEAKVYYLLIVEPKIKRFKRNKLLLQSCQNIFLSIGAYYLSKKKYTDLLFIVRAHILEIMLVVRWNMFFFQN